VDDRVRIGADQDSWLAENKARILSSLPASGEHLIRMLKKLGFDVK